MNNLEKQIRITTLKTELERLNDAKNSLIEETSALDNFDDLFNMYSCIKMDYRQKYSDCHKEIKNLIDEYSSDYDEKNNEREKKYMTNYKKLKAIDIIIKILEDKIEELDNKQFDC